VLYTPTGDLQMTAAHFEYHQLSELEGFSEPNISKILQDTARNLIEIV
jgi:hypothetical protein